MLLGLSATRTIRTRIAVIIKVTEVIADASSNNFVITYQPVSQSHAYRHLCSHNLCGSLLSHCARGPSVIISIFSFMLVPKGSDAVHTMLGIGLGDLIELGSSSKALYM